MLSHSDTPRIAGSKALRFFAVGIGLPLVCLAMGACSTADRFLKAKPAQPAGFLVHPAEMNPHPGKTPFHYAAHSKSREVHDRAATKSQIYIAPVDTRGLRPIRKTLTKATHQVARWQRPAEDIARQIRLEFAQAFADSGNPRYQLAPAPNLNSLSLELALIELDPTSVTGNTARTLGNYFLTPLIGLASFGRTAGSIAIEGKLVNSATGEVVFQFADREADQYAVVSVKNYQQYGFIDQIIANWAKQFEEFTRTPTDRSVNDTWGFTLNPF